MNNELSNYEQGLQEAYNNGTLWQDLPPEMGQEAAVLMEAGILARFPSVW